MNRKYQVQTHNNFYAVILFINGIHARIVTIDSTLGRAEERAQELNDAYINGFQDGKRNSDNR